MISNVQFYGWFFFNEKKEFSSETIDDKTKFFISLDASVDLLNEEHDKSKTYIKNSDIEYISSIMFNNYKYDKIDYKDICHRYIYKYDNEHDSYILEDNNEWCCGSASFIYTKYLSEEEKNGILTVYANSIDWFPGQDVSYYDSNNKLVNYSTEKMTEQEEQNFINKHANKFKWTFVKNKKGNYVFDNVIRIR